MAQRTDGLDWMWRRRMLCPNDKAPHCAGLVGCEIFLAGGSHHWLQAAILHCHAGPSTFLPRESHPVIGSTLAYGRFMVGVCRPPKESRQAGVALREPLGYSVTSGTLRINASPAWARQTKPDRKQAPSKINVSVSRAYLGA